MCLIRNIKKWRNISRRNRYEYEVEACVRAMKNGELECAEMPHEESVQVMELMDGIRESWRYEIPEIK